MNSADTSGRTTQDRQAAVRQAIDAADQEAGDDVAFVRALRRHYFAAHPAPAAPGLAMAGDAPPRLPMAADADPRVSLFDDPRYARNARLLARRAALQGRIVGGVEVQGGDFADCVAVGSDAGWGCTGTLIAPDVVLTAGHCAEVATRVFIGNDVTAEGTTVEVRRAVPHPAYSGKKLRNDLMILLLDRPVADVEPRAIAPASLTEAATDGRLVGFGTVDASGSVGYGIKRQVDVPVASPACSGSVGASTDAQTYGCFAGQELVAGKPLLSRDSCRGDSGGPFYVMDAAGRWLIAAATSRATAQATHPCGDGGLYVRVDRYLDWIATIDGVVLA